MTGRPLLQVVTFLRKRRESSSRESVVTGLAALTTTRKLASCARRAGAQTSVAARRAARSRDRMVVASEAHLRAEQHDVRALDEGAVGDGGADAGLLGGGEAVAGHDVVRGLEDEVLREPEIQPAAPLLVLEERAGARDVGLVGAGNLGAQAVVDAGELHEPRQPVGALGVAAVARALEHVRLVGVRVLAAERPPVGEEL